MLVSPDFPEYRGTIDAPGFFDLVDSRLDLHINNEWSSVTIFTMAPESKDERDKRVAKLWETLDTRREGHIDLHGLKKGLKKIDHRESGGPAFSEPTNVFLASTQKRR